MLFSTGLSFFDGSIMYPRSIWVVVDVGSPLSLCRNWIAGRQKSGQFDIDHDAVGFSEFVPHIETVENCCHLSVAVGIEGYNGCARPMDISPGTAIICTVSIILNLPSTRKCSLHLPRLIP